MGCRMRPGDPYPGAAQQWRVGLSVGEQPANASRQQTDRISNSEDQAYSILTCQASVQTVTIPAGQTGRTCCPEPFNTHLCSWCFCSSTRSLGNVGASRDLPARYARYFRAFGHRVRSYRLERKLTQEDMISYGFSVRHWQMIESGRPITVFTLLRICETFDIAPEKLIDGLAHHLWKSKKG